MKPSTRAVHVCARQGTGSIDMYPGVTAETELLAVVQATQIVLNCYTSVIYGRYEAGIYVPAGYMTSVSKDYYETAPFHFQPP